MEGTKRLSGGSGLLFSSPESRDKLMSLAEPSATASQRQQQQTSRALLGKSPCRTKNIMPKMGTKEAPSKTNKLLPGGVVLRRRGDALANASAVYSSEKSLPDRFADALKGFGSKRHSATYILADCNQNGSLSAKASGAAADSGSTSQASTSAEALTAVIRVTRDSERTPARSNRATMDVSGSGVDLVLQPKFAYGLNNLDDLKHLYKSLPDCSADDDEAPGYECLPCHHATVRHGHPIVTEDHLSPIYANADELTLHTSVAVHPRVLGPPQVTANASPFAGQPSATQMRRTMLSPAQSSDLARDCCSPADSGYRSVTRAALMAADTPTPTMTSVNGTWSLQVASCDESASSSHHSSASNASSVVPPVPIPPPSSRVTYAPVIKVKEGMSTATLMEEPFRVVDPGAAHHSIPPVPVPLHVKSPRVAPILPPQVPAKPQHSPQTSGLYSSSRRQEGVRNNKLKHGVQEPKAVEPSLDADASFEDTFSDFSSPSYSSRSSGPGTRQHSKKVNGASSHEIAPLGRFDTFNTNLSVPDDFSLERCSKLVELDRVPWNEKDIVTVLQKGRTRDMVNEIAIDVVPRLTYLLQRPLIRIARETQRLCQRFGKCTKHDVQFAAKIMLPGSVGDTCLKAALQACAMFLMSGETIRLSKSNRAGLRFNVGTFFRWMCDAQISLCIHEHAAIFMAAVMECLLEEVVLQCRQAASSTCDMLTSESLEMALNENTEMWGLFQPYQHFICGRNANGILSLPFNSSGSVSSGLPLNAGKQRKHEKVKTNGSIVKNLEQSLLATCVGSVNELGELINRVLHHQSKATGSNSCLASCGLTPVSGKTPLTWSSSALQTLYYYMRCSQLEHTENPNTMPPTVLLANERPYLALPPLVEWLRVSCAHCEHRQGTQVDTWDVMQAARVLLPGLDCPPRSLGSNGCWEDSPLVSTGRQSPQTCSNKLKLDLGFRLLAAGRSDLVQPALALLGAQKLDTLNDQGLTPLMLAAAQGDESSVRVLLDSGANINFMVPSLSNVQLFPNLVTELAGWCPLTFATTRRCTSLVQYLLERGAAVESQEMRTETPLQVAAMMGHYELVSLFLSRGADPFRSTLAENGFKQRGCPSALVLAAGFGHRTVTQLLLSRRKCKSDEVLSLEDFLAEGTGSPRKAADSTDSDSSQQGGLAALSLNKSQQRTLQEAMYHAAENGHLDITMDLRNLGIAWNAHVWIRTLATAQEYRRKALVQLLLTDFVNCRLDDFSQEFVDDGLPLLFDIFRHTKHEIISSQLAEILTYLYGSEPIPPVPVSQSGTAPRIDAKYVNNQDLSDVQFLVEGQVFYGHKIVLVNASERIRNLIAEQPANNGQNKQIVVNHIRYDVFQMLMEYLYNGKATECKLMSVGNWLELLAAAEEFSVSDLKLHCEAMISKSVNVDNCLEIYRHSMCVGADSLLHYCEGFFLQNLPRLLREVEGFKKILYSSKHGAYDVVAGLLTVLAGRMCAKFAKK